MKKKKPEGKNKFDLSSKRRKKKNRKAVSWTVLAVLAVGAFLALAYMPFLNLQGVEVAGTEGKEADKMKSLATALISEKYYAVLPKSNIAIYPRDEIRHDILKRFPSIKNATVKTSLEGKLLIEVEKREFKSIWCSEASKSANEARCYLVDQGGLIFAEANGDELAGYLRLEGYVSGDPIGQVYGSAGLFNFFLRLSKQLDDLGLRTQKFRYYDQDKAEAALEDGSKIYFTPVPSREKELFSNLSIFANELKAKNGGDVPVFQYIDLRYGNKIFYKLK